MVGFLALPACYTVYVWLKENGMGNSWGRGLRWECEVAWDVAIAFILVLIDMRRLW